MAGTSGSFGLRFALTTPSGRSLPVFFATSSGDSKIMSTWPDMTSASGEPL